MVNPYNKYIKQYQASNITTATPEKLMIMLFDGAIQFLQKAKVAIEEKNLKDRSENIESARKIVSKHISSINKIATEVLKKSNVIGDNCV